MGVDDNPEHTQPRQSFTPEAANLVDVMVPECGHARASVGEASPAKAEPPSADACGPRMNTADDALVGPLDESALSSFPARLAKQSSQQHAPSSVEQDEIEAAVEAALFRGASELLRKEEAEYDDDDDEYNSEDDEAAVGAACGVSTGEASTGEASTASDAPLLAANAATDVSLAAAEPASDATPLDGGSNVLSSAHRADPARSLSQPGLDSHESDGVQPDALAPAGSASQQEKSRADEEAAVAAAVANDKAVSWTSSVFYRRERSGDLAGVEEAGRALDLVMRGIEVPYPEQAEPGEIAALWASNKGGGEDDASAEQSLNDVSPSASTQFSAKAGSGSETTQASTAAAAAHNDDDVDHDDISSAPATPTNLTEPSPDATSSDGNQLASPQAQASTAAQSIQSGVNAAIPDGFCNKPPAAAELQSQAALSHEQGGSNTDITWCSKDNDANDDDVDCAGNGDDMSSAASAAPFADALPEPDKWYVHDLPGVKVSWCMTKVGVDKALQRRQRAAAIGASRSAGSDQHATTNADTMPGNSQETSDIPTSPAPTKSPSVQSPAMGQGSGSVGSPASDDRPDLTALIPDQTMGIALGHQAANLASAQATLPDTQLPEVTMAPAMGADAALSDGLPGSVSMSHSDKSAANATSSAGFMDEGFTAVSDRAPDAEAEATARRRELVHNLRKCQFSSFFAHVDDELLMYHLERDASLASYAANLAAATAVTKAAIILHETEGLQRKNSSSSKQAAYTAAAASAQQSNAAALTVADPSPAAGCADMRSQVADAPLQALSSIQPDPKASDTKPHIADETPMEPIQLDPADAAVEAARQHAATAVALAAKALQQTSDVQTPDSAAPEQIIHAPAAAAAASPASSSADDHSHLAAGAEAAGAGTAWHDCTAGSGAVSAESYIAAAAADAASAAAVGRQAELDAKTIAMTAEIAARSAAMAAIADAKAALAKARLPRPDFDWTGNQGGSPLP